MDLGSFMSWIKRSMHQVRQSFFLIGLSSIFWFLFRTGTKPSRMYYPCQRASAATGGLWLTSYALPFVMAINTIKMPSLRSRSLIIAGLMLAFVLMSIFSTNMFDIMGVAQVASSAQGTDIKLIFSDKQAQSSDASDIFVVNGTNGNEQGINELIGLMKRHGLPFYADMRVFGVFYCSNN